MVEIIQDDIIRGRFKAAIFDFDGTISLIRAGWQDVMYPYFVDVLAETPHHEGREALEEVVREFVDLLTGKQTIYQCIQLVEEVKKRGGVPLTPLEYKHEYLRRLWERIEHRVHGLEDGSIEQETMLVPGAVELLMRLRSKGLTLYLASGTDEPYVLHEAAVLGVAEFFDGGIYGALDRYEDFSKEKVIREIIASHRLAGEELLGFGDGYVEIENVKSVGGYAVGVASDEIHRAGINEWKRERLIGAGADLIIPDYGRLPQLIDYLFPEEQASRKQGR
ncbi:MAG: HAD family hydrolase [Firmicutes bacterium]|nr:HAD family hydrolase [Bacillota bacterium]